MNIKKFVRVLDSIKSPDLNADVYESEYEKAVDEIDSIEQHFKININLYTQKEKNVTQIDRRSINNDDVLYLLRHDNHFCYIKKIAILKKLKILYFISK